MIAIQTRPGYVTFQPTGGTVEQWEQEYAEFCEFLDWQDDYRASQTTDIEDEDDRQNTLPQSV